MEHEHTCGAGCGGGCAGGGCAGGCCCGGERPAPLTLTEPHLALLRSLAANCYLPVARFVLTSTKEHDFRITALAPVHLYTREDTMETARATATLLTELEQAGLLTVDYDEPLRGCDYAEYHESALYAYFCQTAREAADRPGFLGDTPVLETGSIALTARGEDLLDAQE